MKLDFYEDPAHGWLKVPKELLTKLGIAAKITAYSYMHGNYAYLEEDCDATLFADALEATGEKFEIDERHITDGQSAIRNYPSFSVEQ